MLIIDDEKNIISALKRLLRRDGYRILTGNSGQEGLDLLAKNDIDVIVADHGMAEMSGIEFLTQAKSIRPNAVRIIFSGYPNLQSINDAVHEETIYKFLAKPWDDEELRNHLEEAFRKKAVADELMALNLSSLVTG
ncbi:MAG: response regulator [Pseudomonadota bacterium]